ncbi:MAG: hypothetical protein JNK51_03725 [Blastocatellia bacterium]|nr:hypothetical protein [Blastocatellia bacterium]
MKRAPGKTAFAILAAAPFIIAGLVIATPIRTGGYHLPVGVAAFAVIAAVMFQFARIGWRSDDGREMVTAGVLFFLPFMLFALLWVGMSTPYHTTPAENLMRYEVLVVGSVAVSCGFLFLFRIVSKRGERYFATLFLGVSMLAGVVYLTWNCFQAGMWLIRVNNDAVTPHIADLISILDVFIFFATIMMYVATAVAALSMKRTHLLSSRASAVFLSVSMFGALAVIVRGVVYPGDPRASSPALYEVPGLIAGIPAMPWLMPCLLGAVLLRRSNETAAGARDLA